MKKTTLKQLRKEVRKKFIEDTNIHHPNPRNPYEAYSLFKRAFRKAKTAFKALTQEEKAEAVVSLMASLDEHGN